MKLSCWLRQYEESDTYTRLGQLFCDSYIKAEWPELFYEESDEVAVEMITEYLVNMHTYPNLPHKTGENF